MILLRALLSLLPAVGILAADADLILHNGRILTADSAFSTVQAVAVRGGKFLETGASKEILARHRSARTEVVDLKGRTVLPGLIDAHVHVLSAALSEYRRPLPPLDSIAAIQQYIREKARTTPKGEWIVVPRTLPPRLKEMRLPTRADLDVTTGHPVAFDGSYVWGANSLALKISGITRDTPNPPGGEVVKGPDGEPNGILRNAARLLKGVPGEEIFTEQEQLDAMEKMQRIYAAAGLTAVGDRAIGLSDYALYQKLKTANRLPIRVVLTWRINTSRPTSEVVAEIRNSPWTTNLGDERLKFGTFKVTLDGGQSVGTAYQRMPYGPFGRQLYGQTNPDARGTLFIEPDKLYEIFSAARDRGWQLTAHVQGGAAIDNLLDAFERLDKVKPIGPTRSHVMHGSFQSEDSLARMARMGIVEDYQPGWLHLDAPALERVFHLSNMRWFSPTKSYFDRGIPVAGGSDHMIGYDKDRAVNPFNPFLNMWMMLTRRTTEGKVIYPEERISRQQAIRAYTTGAAFLQFSEKVRGSIEAGKLADLVIIDRDILTCPEDDVRRIQPVATLVEGVVVAGTLPRD
ncbi:MAG: amidohydrolase [Bryobacteraceae bacterium]|nr:amidohydrolase [Bryobacteraceae bacterium]